MIILSYEITNSNSNLPALFDKTNGILSFSPEQLKILYGIEGFLTQQDIDESKNHIFTKEAWLSKWIEQIGIFLNEDFSPFKSIDEIIGSVKAELEKSQNNIWLNLAFMEAALFKPYFPFSADESLSDKEKSKNKEFLDAAKTYKARNGTISAIAEKTDPDYDAELLPSCLKDLKHNQIKLDERYKKSAIIFGAAALGSTALAVLSAGFAAPIAVALVGSQFSFLSGAALSAASLAALGGGAVAFGGLGMAGGTAFIVGGGAVLGLICGGSLGIGYNVLETRLKDGTVSKEDLDCMIHDLAKLVTVATTILSKGTSGILYAKDIAELIRNAIKDFRNLADNIEFDTKDKKSLKNVEKLIDALKKAYEIITEFYNDFKEIKPVIEQ